MPIFPSRIILKRVKYRSTSLRDRVAPPAAAHGAEIRTSYIIHCAGFKLDSS